MEYQEFNKNWDNIMVKSQEDNQQAMRNLEDKHVNELE